MLSLTPTPEGVGFRSLRVTAIRRIDHHFVPEESHIEWLENWL